MIGGTLVEVGEDRGGWPRDMTTEDRGGPIHRILRVGRSRQLHPCIGGCSNQESSGKGFQAMRQGLTRNLSETVVVEGMQYTRVH